MSKYRIGRVYKIISIEGNECYVGSTFNTTRDRFKQHKRDYKYWKGSNGKLTSSYDLFDKYGFDKCKMILIKEYQVCDKNHLRVYEQLWINKLKPINHISSFRIDYLYQKYRMMRDKDYYKEYREKNKEQLSQKKKEYREKNKELISQKKKEYYQEHKEDKNKYNKTYYKENKEKIKEQQKEWYERNKEKIECECGCLVGKGSLIRHQKTKKHEEILKHKL